MVFKNGFSIVEVLLVLAILSIILTVAIPFGRQIIDKNNVKAHSKKLRATINFARIAAIGYGENVKLCGSKNRKDCNGTWQDELIITTQSGKVLQVLAKVSGNIKLTWPEDKTRFRKGNEIDFKPIGLFKGQQASFRYYIGNASVATVELRIDMDGRARIFEVD